MVRKILFFGIPALLLVATIGFLIWGSTPLPPTSQALAAMETSPQVSVEQVQGWSVFRPAGSTPKTGFIFYPGGRVDYRAYAPILRAIAEQGYTVVLVPMPLSLAIFGIEKAQEVITAFPEITHWAIGGHSLGGSMAAQFVANHPGKIDGLVFWASYPSSSLVNNPIRVISIHGSLDGLATPAKIDDSRKNLSPATQFVTIAGGNHAQFGSYGLQPGDGTALIAPSEQWQQAARATAEFLKSLQP
jgi:hypothetical protein